MVFLMGLVKWPDFFLGQKVTGAAPPKSQWLNPTTVACSVNKIIGWMGENLMEMLGPYFRHHTSTVKIVQDERDVVSVHLITTRTRRKKLETSVLRSFFFWVLTSSKLCKPLSESSKVQISKAHSNYSNITTLSFYQVVILITIYHLIEWSYITLIYADHHLCKPRTQITLVLVGSSALFWRVDLQK